MKLSQILSADTLTNLVGNTREHRQVVLSQGAERLTLPVTPWKYQVQTSQNNQTIEILDTGERLIFGNPKLAKIKFSCFFPALNHKYPFVVGDKIEPADCIGLIDKWLKSKSPVRLIITQSSINLMTAIDSFDYDEQDGTRDVNYRLSLVEYRDFNIATSSNSDKIIDKLTGLRGGRSDERTTSEVLSLVGKTSDVLEASKFIYGDFSSLNKITSTVGNLKNFKIKLTSPGWKF